MSLLARLLTSRRPPLASALSTLSLLGESAAHRAALAAVELEEAREHACLSAVMAGVVATLVLCTGFAFTLLVASLVWDDPHRGWWLGGLALVYLAAAGATGWKLRQRLRSWQPLRESHHQLQQDYQCLTKLLNPDTP